ncbi:Phosphatidate cytidylyltransferase [Candidatus Sulfopaludibacter sp. SbA4]|nr:Phosphatidate cytidylyltransferase [Candidatus Sulfopaludibacter sp. SbA4]
MRLEWLFLGTLAVLAAATLTGQVLRRTARSEAGRRTVANLNLRIAAWWVLCGAMGLALVLGDAAMLALFAVFSLIALHEFLALMPGGRSLFRDIAVFVPLQYWFLWIRSYTLFSLFIPLCGFVYIALRQTFFGGTERFLERTAKAYWGLILCAYLLSHAPAVLMLTILGYPGRSDTLLFYLLLVVESSDVMQYVCGKLLGRRPMAPTISPHKTWEGFLGGVLSAIALGTALYRATPFSPRQAAALSAAVTLAGFAGGMTMSAIKRDCGIKDFGTIVAGHGGVLDRIDSLCFAAPVFFYVARSARL